MTVIIEYPAVSRSTAGIIIHLSRGFRSAENPREIASRSGRRIIFARIMPVTTVVANRCHGAMRLLHVGHLTHLAIRAK